MKRILSLVLCIMLAISCAFCEASMDPIAENAPYEEGMWVAFGGGYEIYLPSDWEVKENYAFYSLYAQWFDMYMSTFCTIRVVKNNGTYASVEELCKAYSRLKAEIIEVNGVRLVDKMKNVAEAQGAGIAVWELWCDDGTALSVEFEMKSDVGEIEEDIKTMFAYILATLRKVQ